jgi:hypothetical protein
MLVEALAWVMYAMDQADEDLIDTDTAVGWMEDVASLIGRLGPEDRRGLLAMVQRQAADTADERMRSAYLAFIEGYGLDDEDED